MNAAVFALARVVRRAPAQLVLLVLVLTAALIVLSAELQTASGNEGFAPDNPELAAAQTLGERFGEADEEVVQVLVRGPAGALVGPEGLAAAQAIEAAVRDFGAPVADRPDRPGVISWLFPVQAGSAEGAGVSDDAIREVYGQALDQMPPEQAALATGLLPDGTDADSADAGLLLVFLRTDGFQGDATARFDGLIELQAALVLQIDEVALPDGFSADAFSFPLLFSDTDTFEAELTRLFATAFGIIVLILGFVYWLRPGLGLTRIGAGRRTVADILLTMATIVMAIAWMNGIAVILGPDHLEVIGPLSEMTQIIPVLLIGLGVDYAIHLTSRYREEVGQGMPAPEAISRAVHTVGVALVLATVTTAVGFLTNIVNPVPVLRDFGTLAAVGIVSAFLLMLTFVPATRLLLDRRAERLGRLPGPALARTSDRILPDLMARTAYLARRAPVPTLVVTFALAGLGVYGLTQLETRFSSTDFVPQDSPILVTFDEIGERFGGGFGEVTQVLVTGDVATPAVHNAQVEAIEALAEIDEVAAPGGQPAAQSPVTVLAQLITPGPDGAPPAPPVAKAAARAGVGPDLRVPPDTDVGALYSAMTAAAPELSAHVLATDDAGRFSLARTAVQTSAGEAGAGQLAEDLRAAFAPVEAAGAEAVATSNPIINAVIVDALQDSQLSSLVITLVAAMLLLVATFAYQRRRPFLGVITIAPVVLVVLWTFGMMAATGIPFGPITATIAALAIGIGVPYSIHITHRYNEDRVRYSDIGEAIYSTVRHTGGALAGSAFTTCAGFGVLVTSSLVPFRQFGLVTVYAIGFALLAATLVLPSMLVLWDAWHRRREQRPMAPPPVPDRPVTLTGAE